MSAPICWSSGPASPASGLRCWPSCRIRRATSSCSRVVGWPREPPGGTAASCPPRSPTGSPTGWTAGPMRCRLSCAWARRISMPSKRPSRSSASTATGCAPARSMWPSSPISSRRCTSPPRSPTHSASRRACWTPLRCDRGSTRPPTSGASRIRSVWRWWTPHGWHGGCAMRASPSGFGCSSGARSAACPSAARVSWHRPRGAWCRPIGWPWRPMPTPHCSSVFGTTWFRYTTTCS
jgi:hypothetical protein